MSRPARRHRYLRAHATPAHHTSIGIFLEKPGGYRKGRKIFRVDSRVYGLDDKIEMELCKGSDLALHVILAIVSTIELASSKAEYSG